MKKNIRYIFVAFCLLLSSNAMAARAENDSTKSRGGGIKDYTMGILRSAAVGMEYRIKAGIAIGGTAPLPIPLEIQKIHGFKPLMNTLLEAEFVKTFEEKPYGLSFGLRLETKGMETDAQVKNYSMKITDADREIAGVWTGKVKTHVSNSYLTLPVLFLWRPSKRWDFKIGPYGSYVLSRKFSGSAYDGYLREGNPTGEKIVFEGEREAIYDFSDDLSKWDWGWQFGTDWRAFPHLLVGLDLTWGMKSIFKKDFETITFNMYPIFLRLNFGYAF